MQSIILISYLKRINLIYFQDYESSNNYFVVLSPSAVINLSSSKNNNEKVLSAEEFSMVGQVDEMSVLKISSELKFLKIF